MNLSIIIPNYNGLELLKKNLPKLLAVAKDAEIIIIDDASKDDSIEYVRKNFPNIKVRTTFSRHPELVSGSSLNKGFSSTVNVGVRHATHEFVLLLNSDCVPEKGSIEKVLADFTSDSIFAVGFAQKSIEGKETIIRGRGLGRFEKGFFYHSYGDPTKTTTQWVSGGAGIFRKSIWEKLGGMDEIYNPFYWEDIDLSYRALKSGYSLKFDPDAFVVHSQTEGSIRTHYKATKIEEISLRNQFLFMWLNISDRKLLFDHGFHTFFFLLKSLVTGKGYAWRAYYSALLRLPQALEGRMRRAVYWTRKDRECVLF